MELLVPIVSMTGVLLMLVFWAWMFWDMTNNDNLPSNVKSTWTLWFVFLSIFAAIYYYVYEYRKNG